MPRAGIYLIGFVISSTSNYLGEHCHFSHQGQEISICIIESNHTLFRYILVQYFESVSTVFPKQLGQLSKIYLIINSAQQRRYSD